MKWVLSAPSKTFLVGEYAVLHQAPGLVLNTGPRFELEVRPGRGLVEGIPDGSPAAKWLEQRRPLLAKWDLSFVDPHRGTGGFGASGAQFLLSHTFTTCLQSSFSKLAEGFGLRDVWHDHQVLSEHRGSGADVLSQFAGGVAKVYVTNGSAQALNWPYPDLGFGILRTHQKVPTHEHLQSLERAPLSLLVPAAHSCVEEFGQGPSELFLSRLRVFSRSLREFQLQAPTTVSLVNVLEQQEWCLMAKGCGALGADTVLFFFPVGQLDKVQVFIKKQSLNMVATHRDLSAGIRMELTEFAEGVDEHAH